MRFTYIDIFAGAGGLSEGFQKNGFQPVAHVEMKREACLTLKTRCAYHYLKEKDDLNTYNKYLKKEISREELYSHIPKSILNTVLNETMSEMEMPSLFEQIDSLMTEQTVDHIDVLVGGPPCQAYSLVGRARSETNMEGDPRNYLYTLYCEVLEKYKPKVFVFENVPGLLTANQGKYFTDMQDRFSMAGYKLDHRILNARNYGVLQNRRRVILIGWREDLGFDYPDIPEVGEKYSVNEMLQDLPSIQPGEQNNNYSSDATEYLRNSGIRTDDDILTWHEARPNLERDREIYRQAIRAWEKDHSRIKYTDLPKELCTHKNRTSFLDRFKVVARDEKYTQTMVAHISKDGHYYIHPDIKQARSISVREAARIQSFPDNYYFEGGRTAAYLQIGNAVPPLMAAALAKQIKKQLEGSVNGN